MNILRIASACLLFSAAAGAQVPAQTEKAQPAAATVPGAQTLPAAATPPAPKYTEDASSKKARAIIDSMIIALGGHAYLNIFEVRQQGRGYGFYRNTPDGVGIPFIRLQQYPDKERYEFFKEKDWVLIHDGKAGYETTFRGTRLEDAKDLEAYKLRSQYSLERVLREWFPDRTTALFYDGETVAETKQTLKVTLMNSKNMAVSIYVDSRTYLPVKKTYTYRDPETRAFIEEADLYDNYRMVQGIQTPFLLTRQKNNELTSQRFLKEVKYNVGAGDAPFRAPKLDYNPLRK